MTFHHIGVACKSMEREIEDFKILGYQIEGVSFIDRQQQVRGCFLKNGAIRIELLEAISENSPIHSYLKRGIKMYHSAYEIKSLEAVAIEMKSVGAIEVVAPVPAIAFNGRRINFWMLRNQHLVEFIEVV